MSSILKALKKVEHVAPPEDRENALRRRIARSGGRHDNGRDRRPLLILGGATLVMLGAFLSIRFLPLQKLTPPVPDSGTAPRQEAAAVDTPRAALPGHPQYLGPGKPLAHTGPAQTLGPAGPPVERLSPPASPVTAPPRKEPQPPIPTPQAKPQRPFPREVLPDLRLEGIVWSDSPGTRFAMIDGEIVRQGSTIQGFRVIRITEDHVLVQSRDGTAEQRLTVR